MTRIEYVACLDQMYQSEGFPPYRWSVFEDSPWIPFDKSLADACIGLISSPGSLENSDRSPPRDQTVSDPPDRHPLN